MGRFYQTLQQMNGDAAIARAGQLRIEPSSNGSVTPEMPAPALPSVSADLAREASLRRVSEQLLAMGAASGARLIVTGCQPGDGASAIAGALALDLAQRLGARTLLAEARPRHSTPDFNSPARRCASAPLLATVGAGGADPAQLASRIERACGEYPVCVIDAGAIRLEPALLGAIDHDAPVLIVARYGSTERRHLLSTMRMVRASGHRTLGIVFNAVKTALPPSINSLFQTGE